MKVTRKFNLDRIGHRYESIDVEVEGADILELIRQIEAAWRAYSKAIVDGAVQ